MEIEPIKWGKTPTFPQSAKAIECDISTKPLTQNQFQHLINSLNSIPHDVL